VQGGCRFPRRARLRRGENIVRLLRTGERRHCGALDVYVAESRTSMPRAGIVVPRHGHSIVERNRLKRRLREVVRLCWLPAARHTTPPQELLVRARPEAYSKTFPELRTALLRGVSDER
jgi:ribonuclease P protein component